MPSIRPDERFLLNLRFDASGPSTTALAAHMLSTGCPRRCRNFRSRMSSRLKLAQRRATIALRALAKFDELLTVAFSEKPALRSQGFKWRKFQRSNASFTT